MIPGDLKPKTPGQWLKLALIPALSLTLLVVLWQPFASHTDATPAVAPQSSVANSTAPADVATGTSPAQRVWPKARLEDVIAFNPFQAEQTSEDEEAAQADEAGGSSVVGPSGHKSRPRLVSSGNLQAIFVDAQGAAAILDSQVIRIGDTLPSGGRVVDITTKGIKLEGL